MCHHGKTTTTVCGTAVCGACYADGLMADKTTLRAFDTVFTTAPRADGHKGVKVVAKRVLR